MLRAISQSQYLPSIVSVYRYRIPITLFACTIILGVGALLAYLYGAGALGTTLLICVSGSFLIGGIIALAILIVRSKKTIFSVIEKSDKKSIQYLVRKENILKEKDKDGNIPLHVAFERAKKDVVEILLDKADKQDVNTPDASGELLIQKALKLYFEDPSWLPIIEQLLNKEASLHSSQSIILEGFLKDERSTQFPQCLKLLVDAAQKQDCLVDEDNDLLHYVRNEQEAAILYQAQSPQALISHEIERTDGCNEILLSFLIGQADADELNLSPDNGSSILQRVVKKAIDAEEAHSLWLSLMKQLLDKVSLGAVYHELLFEFLHIKGSEKHIECSKLLVAGLQKEGSVALKDKAGNYLLHYVRNLQEADILYQAMLPTKEKKALIFEELESKNGCNRILLPFLIGLADADELNLLHDNGLSILQRVVKKAIYAEEGNLLWLSLMKQLLDKVSLGVVYHELLFEFLNVKNSEKHIECLMLLVAGVQKEGSVALKDKAGNYLLHYVRNLHEADILYQAMPPTKEKKALIFEELESKNGCNRILLSFLIEQTDADELNLPHNNGLSILQRVVKKAIYAEEGNLLWLSLMKQLVDKASVGIVYHELLFEFLSVKNSEKHIECLKLLVVGVQKEDSVALKDQAGNYPLHYVRNPQEADILYQAMPSTKEKKALIFQELESSDGYHEILLSFLIGQADADELVLILQKVIEKECAAEHEETLWLSLVEQLIGKGVTIGSNHQLLFEFLNKQITDTCRTCFKLLVAEAQKQGCLNLKNAQGSTLLHVILEGNRDQNVIDVLLTHGASLVEPDAQGITPFDLVMKPIGSHAFSPTLFMSFVHQYGICTQDKEGNTLFHRAFLGKIYNVTETLLENSVDFDWSIKNISGQTVCHIALQQGHCDSFITQVINQLSSPVAALIDEEGNTLLHALLKMPEESQGYENRERYAESLINLGVSPYTKNVDGKSAFEVACLQTSANKVGFLNPLLIFLKNTTLFDEEKFKILIQEAKDNNNLDYQDQDGNCALHYVHDIQQAKMLTEAGASLGIYNEERDTPLHKAIRRKEHELTGFLITQSKPQELHILNKAGDSGLHLLIRSYGSLDENQDLLESVPKECWKVCTDTGETLLHWFFRSKLCNDTSKNKEIWSFLKDHGLSEIAVDKNGQTPLHYAAKFCTANLMIFDVFREQDIESADSKGNTLLHIAAWFENNNVVAYLLPNSPRLDVKNKSGSTPLHLACKKAHPLYMYSFLDVLSKSTVDGRSPRC